MSRLQSVDVLRTLAIISVIAIHTTPFEIPASPIGRDLDLATAINQFARFAVPFFFVLSGYFWAQKFKNERQIYEPSMRMAKRIAIVFVAWSAIYLLPMNIVDWFAYGAMEPVKQFYWNLAGAMHRPLVTILEGTKIHLWYLVALLCGLGISALFLRFGLKHLLVGVAVALYATGLAGKAYSDTPLGFHADFDFRDGPFFSTLFFVTGYFLQRSRPTNAWLPIGLAAAILGLLLHFGELLALHRNWGTTMSQDYVVGTYFLGLGAALIALSNPGILHLPRIASIGPLVLGIYASHFIFVEILRPLDRYYSGNGLWEVSYVALVFLLSYALASALARFQLSRRLVA